MKNTKLIALLVCLTLVVCSFAGCTALPFDPSDIPLVGDLFVKTAALEFDAVDGELVGEAPAAYSDNAALVLPEAELQYYAFLGWSLSEDGSNPMKEIPAKFELTEDQIANGIVLYAVYERLSGSVVYDLAGGAWVDEEGPASYLYGEVVELPEVEKDLFEFVGWTLNGEAFDGIVESTAGDLALVATWKQVETEITYVLGLDGATLPDAEPTFSTEKGLDLTKAEYIPTAPGALFAGWYTDADFTQAVTEISKNTTNAVTLYAKWAEIEKEPEVVEPDTSISFKDVKANDWFYTNVQYVVENKLMNGVAEDKFAPNDTLTRAMLVTVLYRNEGEPAVNKSIPFADVDMGAWYANAVSWAKQNGIVNGVTENEFAPDSNITREQIATIMFRYAQYKGYDVSVGENTNILSYDDFDSISEYAIAAMQYACGSGLMKGKTASTLNPKDNATRAEIAAVLYRFIEANK